MTTYDKSDPRSQLSTASASNTGATEFAGCEIARFYETEPQETAADSKTWYARGNNFIISYSEVKPGGTLSRKGQVDEYVVLISWKDNPAAFKAGNMTGSTEGYSVTFMPPGDSSVTLPKGGKVVRMFSPKSSDVAAKCSNMLSFTKPSPNVAPFKPWPAPPDGYKIRTYSLDVPSEPGRFGRIFRCTTFMVNFLPTNGARDLAKVSPHHHDDFEQCSLAVAGSFMHHQRWPWTTNMHTWRNDQHEYMASPSFMVIPPPEIHTTNSMDPGLNELVDIFAPPRIDFSEKPGWVLNAADYPMPAKQ
jgi:hypothetical protein